MEAFQFDMVVSPPLSDDDVPGQFIGLIIQMAQSSPGLM